MLDKIGNPAPAGPAAVRDDPKKIEDAARQFESLLLAQLLKSMRESSTGWLTSGDDQAGATATELAEEQFAHALASQGGLGLARLVVSGLNKGSDQASAVSSQQSASSNQPLAAGRQPSSSSAGRIAER